MCQLDFVPIAYKGSGLSKFSPFDLDGHLDSGAGPQQK